MAEEALPGELDVVVVCNGCHDRTAETAKEFGRDVRVFEIPQTSKTDALNLGNAVARAFPRLFLDADVRLSTRALRQLVTRLNGSGKLLAAGRMDIDLSGCDGWVRAFHRVWRLQPYFDFGKVGGAFALSREGWQRIGRFPAVTADDEFVRRTFQPGECVVVEGCRFMVDSPRTLASLVRVKARVRRGNMELSGARHRPTVPEARSRMRFVWRIAFRPWLWPSIPAYIIVVVAAHLGARRALSQGTNDWARDVTSRANADSETGHKS